MGVLMGRLEGGISGLAYLELLVLFLANNAVVFDITPGFVVFTSTAKSALTGMSAVSTHGKKTRHRAEVGKKKKRDSDM